jgi:mannose-1-phosphate guanylyltransferase
MVHRFFEKPNQQRAEQYVESGLYCWNSGMVVTSIDTIWNAFEEHMPELFGAAKRISDVVGTEERDRIVKAEFEPLEATSIDFGVLELARNCAMIWADSLGWSDVGSWDAWAEHYNRDAKNNLFRGEVVAIESRNCTVHSEHRLCAVVGVEDLIIVDSGDALLVCSNNHVQDVKLVVDELRRRGRVDLT